MDNALWNSEKSAAATVSLTPDGSLIFVFLRQPDGTFLKVDVSQVENGNFGKLGDARSYYERFETTPLEWSTG